jgi:signal transduction histidine kinase
MQGSGIWRRLKASLKRGHQDTFSKRLFLLLWATLVLSHVLGFSLLHPERPEHPEHELGPHPEQGELGQGGLGRPPGPGVPPNDVQRMVMPPFLPPHALPGLGDGPHGPRREGLAPADRPGPGQGPGAHEPHEPHEPHGQPWLEYIARFLVLGLGAWMGARWLTAPMRKLAAASQALSRAITQRGALPLMDEAAGPVEVRQTAAVFNNMARHLHEQFEQRSLMMAAVSHDLRTPLTRLRLRLERLQPDPEVARCVADVRDINAMIDAVLDAMNEERRHESPELIDVLALVQAMADDLQEAGHPVCATGEAASVRVPPVGLRRVLDNLIGNALRHGQRADIQVSLRPAEPSAMGIRKGRCVHIAIDDSGPGIPEDQLKVVFKPFYKLDTARARAAGDTGGSGLGLYIARELVDRAGGEITLSNRPEGGLRATLIYPAA